MYERRNSQQLEPAEKARYVSVLNQLISAQGDPNPFGNLVAIHREHMKYMMHPQMGDIGAQRFLTWHRVYLLKVEEMAKAIDSEFSIPYWDWRTEREVPQWLVNFRPTVHVPGDDIAVRRNPPKPGINLPTAPAIDNVMKAESFLSFTLSIDLPHGTVHNWLNGTMSDFSDSPNDPLFWLHHAMIDKLWSEWQRAHPDQGPTLTGKWKKMSPWQESYDDVKSIDVVGYKYT